MSKWSGLITAILFVAGTPVEKEDLRTKAGITPEELEEALHDLDEQAENGSGFTIIRLESKLQLATNPMYAKQLQDIFQPHTEGTLSTAMLETLTIIAYQQPVTRARVEQLRGVRSVYAINTLLNRGFIEKVGTMPVIGAPALYGTTDAFLRQFGLKSLEDLPPLESVEQLVLEAESTTSSSSNSADEKTAERADSSDDKEAQASGAQSTNAQPMESDQSDAVDERSTAQEDEAASSEGEVVAIRSGAASGKVKIVTRVTKAMSDADRNSRIADTVQADVGAILDAANDVKNPLDEQQSADTMQAQLKESSSIGTSDSEDENTLDTDSGN